MNRSFTTAALVLALAGGAWAQPGDFPPGGFGPEGGFGGDFPPDQFEQGRGGGRGRGGMGRGGPGGGERKLVSQFDANGDGWLNREERDEARALAGGGGRGGRGGGRGGRGPGGRGGSEPGRPGPRVSPTEVAAIDAPLYEPLVLRTLFLDFEHDDWEQEMAAFNNTDVEIPGMLTVDGKTYPNVGVHFRGMSSFMGVGEGSKRSLNVSLDFIDGKQRLYGYKTLNLLNAHEDPSMLHTVLYSHIARNYLPTPKANLVKVVINGESWGVYTSVQQFDKIFVDENYKSAGTRWKVPGSPGGRGGLEYFGEDLAEYKRVFEMKSDDSDAAWKALVNLCRVLNETPVEELEAALEPILDVDGVLRFLALEAALVNGDGYWTRASDYSIFLDAKGKFHIIPHDMNEVMAAGGPGGRGGRGGGRGGPGGFGGPEGEFNGPPPGGFEQGPGGEFGPRGGRRGRGGFEGGPEGFGPRGGQPGEFGPPEGRGPGGPGFGGGRGGRGGGRGGPGGPGGGGVNLDPLVGLNDPSKPLRSRLLAVPSLRTRYLKYVRDIATDWLDWNRLGPVVTGYANLIDEEVQADTRKLSSYDAFRAAVSASGENAAEAAPGPGRGGSIKSFADQRRAYLLNHEAIRGLGD